MQILDSQRLPIDLTPHCEVQARVHAYAPEVLFARWGGEAAASFRLLHDQLGLVSQDQRAIVWTSPDVEARFYALQLGNGGGFEFALHLPRCPRSNIFRFAVNAPGLALDEQPSLAHQHADGSSSGMNPWGGAQFRPFWAVDSVTVYSTRQGDYSQLGGWNYRSGKVLHIHRAWARDAVGHFTWCHLTVVGDELRVSVPWEFLHSAVYPVMVDPTFGYTTHGASDDNPANNFVWCKATSTPGSTGTLDSMTAYGRIKAGAPTFNPALFSTTAGAPDARLSNVDSGGTAFTGSNSEITTAITNTSHPTNGTQYYLGVSIFNADGITLDAWITFDSNGGATELYYVAKVVFGAGWPTAATGTSNATDTRYTIFATYTAAGGGGPVARNSLSNRSVAVHRAAVR